MSPHRLLVRGGEVVDGTGTPPRRADVLVEHGVIAAVGEVSAPRGARVLDATALLRRHQRTPPDLRRRHGATPGAAARPTARPS